MKDIQKTKIFYIGSHVLLGTLALVSLLILRNTNQTLDLAVGTEDWLQSSELAAGMDWAEKAVSAVSKLVVFIF